MRSRSPNRTFEGLSHALNYGLNRGFRRPSWLGMVRLAATILEVTDAPDGVQAVIDHRFELEGAIKPACVARHLVRLVSGTWGAS